MAPVMTLGNDLENMSLNGSSHRPKDPVAEAVHQGRLPTLREVKKSVKVRIDSSARALFLIAFSDYDEDPYSSYHSHG